jgi:hypothetical protein
MRPLRLNSEIAQRVDAMVAQRNSQVISRSAAMPEDLTALLLQRLAQKPEPQDAAKIEKLRKMIEKILKHHSSVQVAVSLKIGEGGGSSPLDRCKNVTIKLDDLFDVRSTEEQADTEESVVPLVMRKSLSEDTTTDHIRVVLTLKGPRSSVKAAIAELGQDVGAFQRDLEDGKLSNKSRCPCGIFRMWACCMN